MLTSPAATARRLARTLPALALAVLAVTCRDNPVAPRGGGLAHLAVQPTFRSPVNLTAFGLTIDSLRVTIVRPVADTIKDTTVFFSPDSEFIHLPLAFELKAASETLSVTLTLSAGGVPLFSGTQMVDVSVGSAGPPVPVSLTFTGPGAGVTALHITPLDSVVRLGDTFRYRVTADSAGTPVTTFYASWSTSDTLVARINAFGILQAPLTRNTIWVIVRTFSGARDSTRVTFVPSPTLLAVASGGAQTGPVGSPLALPLRARVTAADGLGVKGVPVTFAPAAGGGSVTTATVVTDTLGFAQTTATLGSVVGTHTFQASAAGLTTVTFSENATAATPTQLLVSAGDGQSAIVGAAVAVAPAVLLKDAFNNPVPGVVVTYAIASGGGSVTKAVDTTNAFGIATVGGWTLGTISGANSLSATAGALSHTFTATGLAGAASATVSTVSVDSATLAAGHATLVHLQAKDAFGNNLTAGGLTVGFSVTGGSSTGSLSVVTDHLNGTYSAVFTGVLSGTADTVHATIGGAAVTSTLPLLTVLPGAASLATSIVTVDSATLASGDSTLVHLQAKDAAGNNLTVGGLTVLFSTQGGGSTGAFSAVTDNGNGTYRAYFKAIIAGTATSVNATIGGSAVSTPPPALSVVAGAASLANSIVTVDSTTLSSGDSTLVHLRAKDAAGNSLTTGGLTVLFSTLGGGSTGTFSGVTDHVDGTYSAYFRAVLSGAATSIHATIGGSPVASLAPSLSVLAGAISAATSVVTTSAGAVLSGSPVTLTLRAKDAAGDSLTTGGATVVFSAIGGTSTGTISATTDNGNGTYTATFTGLLAGTADTIHATIGGTPVTTALPTVAVLAGAVSAATSLVTVDSATLASGDSTVVHLQARDAAGNNIATGGATVAFSRTGVGTGTFSGVVDHLNGTYTATFTGVLAGGSTIGATVNTVAVTSTRALSIVPGAVSLTTSTLSSSSGTISSGALATLTLGAKDAAGNSLTAGGLTVTFTAAGGTSTGTFSGTTDLGNGSYSATFLGVTAGTATTIGAKIGGTAISATQLVTVVPGNAVTAQSVVSVSSATVPSGGVDTLKLQAKDSLGNNLTAGGLTVVFTHSGGVSTGTISATTDHGDGTYSAIFAATVAGTATTIGATIGGAPVTSTLPSLTVLAGAASTVTSIITTGLPTIASGTGTSLTLQAKDASGNNLTTGGLAVVFSASGGTSTGLISATTDNGNGTYSATFTGVLAGTSTLIGATINSTPVSSALPSVTVTAGAISTVTSVVSTTAALVLSGGNATLNLLAKDAAGNAITVGGATVVFTRSGGTSTGTITGTTDNGSGDYSATFTGVLAGTATTIGATINGSAVTSALPTVTVVPGSASTLTSLVSVDSASLASGHLTQLRLQTKDLAGNNLTLGGSTVTFTVSGGTGTGTVGTVIDNGNGTYQAPFTALLAGTADTVHATIGGVAVTTTLPTLTVLAGTASAATSTITTAVDSVVSGASLVLTLHAKDAAGNPITSGGATVVFSASGGTSTATVGATTDNANGTYDASLTGVLAGTPDTIHALVNGLSVSTTLPTVFVVPGAVALSRSVITVSDSVAIAAVADTLTLQAKDSAGNNLTRGGLAVVFAITGGTSTGLITGTTDLGNGRYTAIFTGIAAGTPAIIGATIGGSPVTSALPGIRVLATLHVSDITAGDSVWTAAASPHIVTRNILIAGQKTLTIEAGAVVKFDSGAGFQVGDSASSTFGGLVLDGTAGTITLTANTPTPTPAFWRGIDVQRLLGGFPWKNVLIEWGGAGGACVTYSDTFGALLDLDSVRVRQCGPTHHGIQMLNGVLHFHRGVMDTTGLAGIGASNGQLEIDSSTFTGMNAGWNIVSPLVRLGPSSANKFFGNGAAAQLTAAQLPGLLRQDTLAGNTDNFLVFGGQPDSSAAVVTLYRQPRGASGLDYRFMSGSGLLDIGSATGQELVLDANLAVGFDAGTGIVIGDSAGTRAGTIRSLGTSAADAPSLASVPPLNSHGGWVGLEIGHLAAPDTLRFVKIQYAGDSLPGRTVFRAGVWVRNPASVPLLFDNVQVLSSGWPVSQSTSGGIVVTGTGSGFDLHNSLLANNAGYQVAVAAPNVRVTGNNLAGGGIGLGGFISGGAQLTAADSLGPNTIDGNGYAVALTPGSLPAFYQTTLGLTNVTDTLLLEGGSLNADAQLPHFPNFVWRALGGITVGGNATLNLAAGNTVAFDSIAGVLIGDTLPGRFTAVAPATAPILLTSSAGLNGTWSGVQFANLAGSGFSDTLRNVIFERAGLLQCTTGVIIGGFGRTLLRRAPKPPRAPTRAGVRAPQRDVIVGGCEFLNVLGAVQFLNQSSASLLLDSVTVRHAVSYAVQVNAPSGGQVAISHGQFYNNTYPTTFSTADGPMLTIDSSDIYHYGRTPADRVIQNNLNFTSNPVVARENWWGDVSGAGSVSGQRFFGYSDSIGRAIVVQYPYDTVDASSSAIQSYFPTGPAVTVVATPDSVVPAAMAGVPLADSIRARAIDAQGRGVSSAQVTWGTALNSGAVNFLSNVADAGGRVGGMWVPSTAAGLDTAFVGLGAPSARFYVNVLPGFATVENLALVDALTQGAVSTDSNSASFTSTGRHGVFVTHARDAFGNVATPSCLQSPQCFYFDDVPGAGFSHGYGTIDSVKADSVFFTVSNGFPTTFQIHASYPTLVTAIEDSVILNVNPVGVAVQIWGFGFGPADSVTYNSVCPSTGPFNFFCQKNVYAYVVDSAGAPLQTNPGYFPQWQPLVAGDTTVGIDPNFQFSFSTPVTAQMNGSTAIVVSVTSSGPPPLPKASDTLYITVQQAPGQIAVTPGNRSLGLGDTTVFHGIVTDSGGTPVAVQPAINWMIPSPSGIGEFPGVVKLDSAADSLIVRLDSGFYNISNYDWEAVVRAFVERAPGDTISGQGVLLNPIVYDQFSITANGQGHAAVDTGAHKMFVVNGGNLEGLNIDNDAPIGTIGIGSSGTWISVDQDSNRVFVADPFTNSVHIIDGVGFTPLGTANLPGTPNGLAVSPVDHRMYTAMRFCAGGPPFCATGTYIVPIDGSLGADTAIIADSVRLAIDTLAAPQGLAFNPATGLLYLSTSTGLVYVYDPVSKLVVDSIVADPGALLQGMAFNPVNGMLYVADWTGSQVLKIDPVTKSVAFVGSVNNPYDVGVDPVHNKIYASSSGNVLLVQVDGATDTYHWLIAGTSSSDEPGNVAVDPRTGVVFVPHPTSLTIYQFYGHSFPAPLTAPRRMVAGSKPTPRSITPRIPAGLLPQGGTRRPPPARRPGITLPGLLPGAKGAKKSP